MDRLAGKLVGHGTSHSIPESTACWSKRLMAPAWKSNVPISIIWRDTGTMTNVSGTLPAGTTTWSPASGPYHVTGNITVPEGATLVIQPGTTVFFDANMGITVQGGRIGYTDGRLVAEGTDTQQIRFALTPTATGNWAGITFSTLRTSGWFKPTPLPRRQPHYLRGL